MKSVFQSKMMWVNGLTLAAGVLVVIQDTSWVMQSYGGLILAAIGIVNMVLRLVTNKAIG